MDSWTKTVFLTASVLASVNPVVAAPYQHDHHGWSVHEVKPFNHSHYSPRFEEAEVAGQKRDNVALRILPLGASIMSGTGSSNGNGCRKYLRDALRLDGYDVDMVGSLHGGTMQDYEHEAVPGDVLTAIQERIPNSIGFKPNLVIINGGTNDGNGNIDISGVGDRMNDILNDLWAGDGMDDTCIILSTLIPTTNTNGAANRDSINSQYKSLVTERAGDGKCIYLADMDPGGSQWLEFDTDYLSTESPHVHPNDSGHRKMAAVYYQAIQKALAASKVVEAGDFEVGPTVCDKVAGTGVDAGGLTQRGSGYDDGIYYHDSEELGIVWSADSDWDRDQWKFGRLFDQDHDDLLAWISQSDDEQVYAVWANPADGKGETWNQISDMSPDLTCEAEGIHFIDMNGDGLDDIVCISSSGNAYLSINQGDGDRAAGKPPTFKRVSDTALIKSNEGQGRDRVVLADIDGDGRGDYGIIDDAGDVYFWRNGWIDDIPKYWQAMGKRFSGHTEGTQFEDINGDGRDDALYVGTSGLVYTYTNGRSCATGREGDGLNVAWRQGFYHGESSGPTHKGVAGYQTDDESNLRPRIHFARIVGESSVFGNHPLQDYVFMQHTELDSGKHRFQMRVWKNTGSGGTKLLADGDKYCNMMGHSNGMVDYVWAYSFGRMEMWANRGKGSITDSDVDGYWDYQGTIWTPPSDMNRRDLHLKDWDGDGTCDIIYADPDTGAVQVWINNYPTTGSWDWTHKSISGLSCSEKRGQGFFDAAVRFADLTGNGHADYLCVEPDGRVTGSLQNDDGSFDDVGQIKVSDGYDRANYHYADVNGDGVDDLIWVEKFSGDGYVWYNQGRGDPDELLGSAFSWRRQTSKAYAGNAAGGCEYFADLDGNGRADEHFILGTFNNKARTALSPSCGLTDRTGDDDTMDGELPTVPSSGSDDDSSGDDDDDGDDSGGDYDNSGDLSDYPSRFAGTDANCATARDFFAPTAYIGNDQGGDSFCMAKWREGVFPKLIEATANKNALCSLRVVFTDNTEQMVGKVCAEDGHHRFGTLEWTPFVNYFSEFSLWAGGYNGGVGRLVAGIKGNNTIDAGKYWDDPPTGYKLDLGSDGKGVLMGFYGTAGDRIDSLEPLFSSAGPKYVKLANATFNPTFEELNNLPFDQRGMTVVSSPADFDNRASSINVEFWQTVELTYEKSTQMTVTNEDGKELGGEFALTFGLEKSVDVEVPLVKWKIDGKGKVEMQGKFVGKHVDKHITSKMDGTVSRSTVSTRLRATLEPGQKLHCVASIIQSHVNLQYVAKMEIMFNDGNHYLFDVEGVYESQTSSQIVSYCEDGGTDEDLDTEDDNTDTIGPMYCRSGEEIGDSDQDLTVEEYAELCPDDWDEYE